ncbi:MAG: class I SAM-dependent methyltransferase [Candidatus Binatia bacterium]|nr:class I SAM-dependent methyltransferase [Candidatus Binatia bacterium]
MVPDSKRAPARIGDWPTEVTSYSLGGREVELLTVASLESLLDRDQLLCDDDFEPPYWALVWSGSHLVAQWLLEDARPAGKSLLDVGCGLGLISLCAAQAGAVVTAVDRDPVALAFVRASSERASVPVEVLEGDVACAVAERTFDVVVAAELLYERTAFSALAEALVSALAPGGVLYLGDAFRIDTAAFYEQLDRLGLECIDERVHFVDEEGTRVRVRLAAYRPR